MAPRLATPRQVRAIGILRRSIEIPDAAYYAALSSRYRVESCKALTTGQASLFLAWLQSRGWTAPEPPAAQAPRQRTRRPHNVVALPTRAQMVLIGRLVAEVEWRDAGSYDAWRRGNLQMERILTSADAIKVIEGLKGLKRHGHARPHK